MRILNAAYKEFAEQGYEKTSTNSIVKEAGIGKGMLFYYFKSKKDLFHYLIDYGINYVINEHLNKIDESEPDFIEKYIQVSKIKMKALNDNPHVFNFFGTLYLKKEVELTEELEERLVEVRKLGYAKLFNNIDTSLFREDVPQEQIIKLIHWSLEGYEKELTNRIKNENLYTIDYKPYWDEFYDYLAVLKRLYYK